MYSRRFGDRDLRFEASGALLQASLVMRDKETDSWWSIMTSDAIGGPLEGEELSEMPVGEKITWGEWRRRHPESLVLSVAGQEHEAVDPYANYFASDGTFRDLVVPDDRLAPKAPVYTFHWAGDAYAVPHVSFEGGAHFDVGDPPRRLVLYRSKGASLFASTRAFWMPVVEDAVDGESDPTTPETEVSEIAVGRIPEGAEPLEGFDTFWYGWVAVNVGSEILVPRDR